jgi:hypothetical protein
MSHCVLLAGFTLTVSAPGLRLVDTLFAPTVCVTPVPAVGSMAPSNVRFQRVRRMAADGLFR